METPVKGNFAYLSALEIRSLWDRLPHTIQNKLPNKMDPHYPQGVSLLGEEVVMPYMITQFLERNRPVETMMNKILHVDYNISQIIFHDIIFLNRIYPTLVDYIINRCRLL